MKRRRNEKISKEKIELASKLIEAGNTIQTIFGALGISKQTWYNWLHKGENAKSGMYRELWEEVQKAESRAETRYVSIIAKAAPENWQAAAWWLERKYPERWARKDRFAFENNDGIKIVIEKVDGSVRETEPDAED